MNKRILIIILLVTIAFISTGCGKGPSKDDKVLASVSNRKVMLSDFKAKIAKVPSYYQDVVDKNKKRFLDETIVEMIFYEEAIRVGLDKDKEVRDVIKEARKKILIAALIKSEVEDKIKVKEDEMLKYYESHKDDFKTPEMWRASHILVATEKEAGDILAELPKGASFEDLARAHSIDATASRGGDVGFFRKGQLIPDFENECLKLSIGELSPIIHTQFGYHIIKLTAKKEPSIEPYEKVRRAIEDILRKSKRSDLFDRLVMKLKNKYNVRIREDVFKSLESLDKDKAAIPKE